MKNKKKINKDQIDFLGSSKKSKKNSFSFLGNTDKNRNNKNKVEKINNFKGFGFNSLNKTKAPNWITKSLYVPIKNKSVSTPFFLKSKAPPKFKSSESTLYGKKNLRLYGDRDLDGSPNKFDCSPGKVNKDGFFSNLLNKVTGGRYGQSDEKYAAEKTNYAKEKADYTKRREEASKGLRKIQSSKGTWAMLKESLRGKQGPLTKQDKAERLEMAKQKLAAKTKEIQSDTTKADWKKEMEITEAKTQIAKETKEQGMAEAKKGLSVHEKLQKYVTKPIQEGMQYAAEGVGNQKTWKEIAKKYKLPVGPAAQQKAAGVVASALATAYPKELLTKDVIRLAKRAQKYPSYGGGKKKDKKGGKSSGGGGDETSSRGRPVGTVKYYIPGQGPVGVYEWRKYSRKVKALQRIQGREAIEGQLQQQMLDQYKYGQVQQQIQQPQPVQQMVQQRIQRVQTPVVAAYRQNIQSQYDPTKGINDNGVYDTTQYQAPADYSEGNLPPEERAAMKEQQQGYQRATWNQRYRQMIAQREMARRDSLQQQQLNPRQMTQLAEQKGDLITNAPQIFKGEMESSSQNPMTYTPPEQNVLNSPNINMGQMRNVDSRGEVPSVSLSQKPIPNARGNEYMEINPINGQPVLRRRPSEKFMTGEAL
jgi:hypothetical protein